MLADRSALQAALYEARKLLGDAVNAIPTSRMMTPRERAGLDQLESKVDDLAARLEALAKSDVDAEDPRAPAAPAGHAKSRRPALEYH